MFYDKTGRRWKVTTAALIISSLFLILSAIHFCSRALVNAHVPQAHQNDQVISTVFPAEDRGPADLAYSLPNDMPVIGNGVFLRISRIEKFYDSSVVVDVYSGQAKTVLSDEQKLQVGNSRYVIEKYGQSNGKHMILTFDDGPDPIYTSQILDILSSEAAHSTFFPVGANVAKYPELAQRMTREGHDVGNHTFSHADLDLVSSLRARQEINQTQRIITAATHTSTALFRIPYGGGDDTSLRDDRRGILEAQKLGYVLASYDFDTVDWALNEKSTIDLPELDGQDKVLLLHDGGGNRSRTVAYLKPLIQEAKRNGYTFTSLSRLYSDYGLSSPTKPATADYASYYAAQTVIVWPKKVIGILFYVSIGLFFATVILSVILAELQRKYNKPRRRHNNYSPLVSVIIPAYNEERVIKKTVSAVLSSRYRNLEVLIVDDGSKDNTWRIIKSIKNKRVRAVSQPNSGKAKAVNKGLALSKGEVIISLDADTIFLPNTIGKLVRHFYDPSVGAVAGVVKVGNTNSWLTRWQALEYITSINIERSAQAFLHAIVVAPGACSAWRKAAIDKVGGYSSSTMAEDCDLTLAFHRAGFKVVQDLDAVGLTECPETLRDLSKQRFRWIYGSVQSFWKHKSIVLRRRYGWLGMYIIPKAIIGIILQIIFTPLMVFVTIGNFMSGNFRVLVVYTLITFVVLVLTAGAGLILGHERWRLITSTPAFRIIYSPLRSILLYATVLVALGGVGIGWNKAVRHGTVGMK